MTSRSVSYIPQVCYVLRSVLLFALYAKNAIELEKAKPQNEETIKNIYFLYRSVANLYYVVSGQSILNPDTIVILVGLIEDSIIFSEHYNRFKYSTFIANTMIKNTKLSGNTFILFQETKCKSIVTLQTHTLYLGMEAIEPNMELYGDLFHREIKLLEDDFEDYIKTLSNINIKFKFQNVVKKLIHIDHEKSASFTVDDRIYVVDYNFQRTIETIVKMGYFIKDDFDSFDTNRINGKILYWAKKKAASKGKFDGVFDSKMQLYYRDLNQSTPTKEKNKKRKTINNKITNNFDDEATTCNNSLSQDFENGLNINDKENNLDEMNTYEQNECTEESPDKLINEAIEEIDTDHHKRGESYSPTFHFTSEVVEFEGDKRYSLNPNLNQQQFNEEFKTILEERVECIMNEKQINKRLLKEYINLRAIHKQTNYLNLYLDLYKDLYQKKKDKLLKIMNNNKAEIKNKKGIVVSLSQKGNIDKELDKFSHQLRYALYQVGTTQIESYFELLFDKESVAIEQFVKGTRYIQTKNYLDKWKILKSEFIAPYWREEAPGYFKLACRLFRDEFHTTKDDTYERVYKRLIKWFEDKMPHDLRQLLEEEELEEESSDQFQTPKLKAASDTGSDYWTAESDNPRKNRSSKYNSLSNLQSNQPDFGKHKKPRIMPNDASSSKIIPANELRQNLMHDNNPVNNTPVNRDSSHANKATAFKQIIDIVENIFKVNDLWRLKKNQNSVDLIFSWLKENNLSKKEFLRFLANPSNHIWEFLVNLTCDMEIQKDCGLEFIRAHYCLLETLIQKQSLNLSNEEILLKALDDAILLEENQPNNKLVKTYKEKVNKVYSKYHQRSEEIVSFNEEEFTFPFLWRHLAELPNLKLIDQTTIRKVIVDGEIQSDPFCLTDLLGKDSSCLLLTSNVVKVINLNVDDIYDKFHQLSKHISTTLCDVSLYQIIENNNISGDDFDYMATMFFAYESNRQTELNKSNYVSSTRSTSSRSSRSSTSSSYIAKIEAFEADLIKVVQDNNLKTTIMEVFKKYFN